MDRSVYGAYTTYGSPWGTYVETSVSTPDFHTLRRLGKKLPVKAYNFRRFDAVDPFVQTYNGLRCERQARGLHFAYVAWQNGTYSTNVGHSRSTPSMASERAIVQNQLLDKVRDQDIDLGVSLGEYRETARFISAAMSKTVRSFQHFRRGEVSKALNVITGRRNTDWRDIPGVASNAWLAYTYGLRPLIKDVYSAMEVLSKPGIDEVPVHTVRSSRTILHHSKIGETYRWTEVKFDIKTRGEISFLVTNPLIKTLDQMGLINPLSVAWELVPFSFVVDWFLPVGKALQQIVPPQGVKFVDGWITHKCRGWSINASNVTTVQPHGWITRCTTREFEKTRSVLTSFPRYHVVVPDLSLSKSQIGSGLALLFQASAWGKQKQRVHPEPISRRGADERNWREQWPNDPWWSR